MIDPLASDAAWRAGWDSNPIPSGDITRIPANSPFSLFDSIVRLE